MAWRILGRSGELGRAPMRPFRWGRGWVGGERCGRREGGGRGEETDWRGVEAKEEVEEKAEEMAGEKAGRTTEDAERACRESSAGEAGVEVLARTLVNSSVQSNFSPAKYADCVGRTVTRIGDELEHGTAIGMRSSCGDSRSNEEQSLHKKLTKNCVPSSIFHSPGM